MNQLVVILPALFALLLLAGSVRLAARILGLKNVRWKLCLIFALVLFLLTVARLASGFAVGSDIPPLAGLVVGIGCSVAIGAWLFGKYVVDPAGHALGWKSGAKLTACALLILGVPALLLLAAGGLAGGA